MPVVRRKRLADGTFGPPEKVFDGFTESEQIDSLGQQLALEKIKGVQKDITINSLEQLINSLGPQVSQLKIELMLLKGGA
jgi:hypothetical protein